VRGSRDLLSDLVTQVEKLPDRAIVALGPDVGTGRRIDELGGDAHALRVGLNAALEQTAHPQFARDLPHVPSLAFLGEARVPGDHGEPAIASQLGDQILGQPVGEPFLLGVAAHVRER
jgi:hypothetical protein